MELGKKLERVQNYGMRVILSKPPRMHREELQTELGWRTLAKRRSIARMMLVQRYVMGQAPTSLCEIVRMNNHVTRGNNKLLVVSGDQRQEIIQLPRGPELEQFTE